MPSVQQHMHLKFTLCYRDAQAQTVYHPGGPKAEGDGHHHVDQGQPVDLVQSGMQVLG